ncbi:hypothetical protein GCM10020220_079460 [Nonomuraea rubra]
MQNVQVLLQPTEIDTPGGVRGLALGGQRGGEDLQRLLQLDLRLALDAGPLQQHRQRADVVRAEDHVDPRRLADDLALVLLRQAAADGDLHARVARLGRPEVSEVAVEAVVGVLPYGTRVEHDHVGRLAVGGGHVAGVLQQA